MNEKLNLIKEKLKKPKNLVIIGVTGIVLIGLSSLFSGKSDTKSIQTGNTFDCEAYKTTLEENVKDIVSGITEDKKPTVVITLENGIRYSYADDIKNDSTTQSGEKSEQTTERKETSHITVKSSSGDEKALIVTEKMPEIRGVAIICEGGDDEFLSEKIISAVTAALDITRKRVYVTGSG